MSRALFVAITLMLSAVSTGAAPPAGRFPTPEEIHKTFDAKDYAGTLERITRVLPLKGDAGKAYDRYALLMLKGEAHLQLKQFKSAGDAFAAAAKETDEPEKAAVARATQRVVRESKAGRVQRRVPKRDAKLMSADLLDPDQRDNAFGIAYDDARAAAEPKVKAATRARTLEEIEAALKVLSELHDLELAATGGDAEHLATRQELHDRATKLIDRELERMQRDVVDIRDNANQIVREKIIETTSLTGRNPDSTSLLTVRRGLSREDKSRLGAIMLDCKRAIETSKSLAKSTTGSEDDADALVARATEVGRLAERVLRAKY